MSPRVSSARLGEIAAELLPRDRELLRTLEQLRCLKSNQIQRLFFFDAQTSRAGLTATMKAMNRLQKLGLVDHLPREVGGVRAGSKGLIWHITEPGSRLLRLGTDDTKRTRFLDGTTIHRRHTIAVAETYVQITEICRMGENMNLLRINVEPECWRGYQRNGKALTLRPDLYAETNSGQYSDHWFIEVDLATESLREIMTKCERYYYYYATEKEQQKTGVFPVVLWIVPDAGRKEAIKESLTHTFHGRYRAIHLIITPNELWHTLTEGASPEDLL